MFGEETEAIESVFCLPGECDIDGGRITVNMQIKSHATHATPEVKVIMSADPDYPQSVPYISVLNSQLSREIVTEMKLELLTFAEDLIGQPMVISLLSWIQEYLERKAEKLFTVNTIENKHDIMEVRTCLLHIDHMRARSKYCKILEKLAQDMSLTGRILFVKRLILIILQGNTENLKKFIVHLRSEPVDIDSRGHNCKERMMSILCDNATEGTNRYRDFQVCELSTVTELEATFAAANLGHLYTAHVQTLKGYLP